MKFLMVKLSDPNLKSWSIIIPPKCRSEDEIENKLENLKKSIELKKHSFGLMFACCERSAIIDLEVKVFKKVFPEVPLAGLSGDGEIGLNTLNDSKFRKIILVICKFLKCIRQVNDALKFFDNTYIVMKQKNFYYLSKYFFTKTFFF